MTNDADRRTPTSFLVVDDHRVFADVLVMRLRTEPGVVEARAAYSLAEARAAVDGFRPELVLLDFQLADENGLDLLSHLGGLAVRPNVLVLSGLSDPDSVVDALEAGAQGWVNKDSDFEVLMRAASQVHQGHMYLAPPTIRPVVMRLLSEARGQGREPGFVDDLSPRELEVLRCLVAGMTRAEVARRLYLSVNTVRTHVQHLLHHADAHSTLALVALARELGVRAIDEDGPRRIPQPRRPE